MTYELKEFRPEHAMTIFDLSPKPLPLNAEEMIRSYTSEGSRAVTLLVDGKVVACGGIINLAWHRGEAWVLTADSFRHYAKTGLKVMNQYLGILAQEGRFARVQATSFFPNAGLFAFLGFKREGMLRKFGPSGEDAVIYSRIFPVEGVL